MGFLIPFLPTSHVRFWFLQKETLKNLTNLYVWSSQRRNTGFRRKLALRIGHNRQIMLIRETNDNS